MDKYKLLVTVLHGTTLNISTTVLEFDSKANAEYAVKELKKESTSYFNYTVVRLYPE